MHNAGTFGHQHYLSYLKFKEKNKNDEKLAQFFASSLTFIESETKILMAPIGINW